MATIVFDGTTLWDDSGTGVGPVQYNEQLDTIRQSFVPIPRYGGYFAKTHGQEPGGLSIVAQYTVTDSELNSLVTTLEGVKNDYGTLTFPPNRSLASVRLVAVSYSRSRPVQVPPGTVKYNVFVQFSFKVLKA